MQCRKRMGNFSLTSSAPPPPRSRPLPRSQWDVACQQESIQEPHPLRPFKLGRFFLNGPRACAVLPCREETLGDRFPFLSFPYPATLRNASHPLTAEAPLPRFQSQSPRKGFAPALGAAVPGCGAALAWRGLCGGAERGGERGGRERGAPGPGRSPDADADAGRSRRCRRLRRRRRRSVVHSEARGPG